MGKRKVPDLRKIMEDFKRKQEALARCPKCGGARFGVSFGAPGDMHEITKATCTCDSRPTSESP